MICQDFSHGYNSRQDKQVIYRSVTSLLVIKLITKLAKKFAFQIVTQIFFFIE